MSHKSVATEQPPMIPRKEETIPIPSAERTEPIFTVVSLWGSDA